MFQAFRKKSDASLEDQLKEAAEKTAAMHVTEKKKERKSSESKDSKKEVNKGYCYKVWHEDVNFEW